MYMKNEKGRGKVSWKARAYLHFTRLGAFACVRARACALCTRLGKDAGSGLRQATRRDATRQRRYTLHKHTKRKRPWASPSAAFL